MDASEALKKKAVAARDFEFRKLKTREKIAAIVVSNPGAAKAAARKTLANKHGEAVAWSKAIWSDILLNWSPSEIAVLLTRPRPEQEALADSHPFGGVLSLSRAR